MFSIATSVLHELRLWAAVTGMSIGALVACGVIFYFLAFARGWAIGAAIAIAVAFVCSVYFEHDGRAYVQAQWDAANAKQDEANKKRDADAEAVISAKYRGQIIGLQQQNANYQALTHAYENQLLAAKSGSCGSYALGARALRLRQGQH